MITRRLMDTALTNGLGSVAEMMITMTKGGDG
jgi:hypothetical protein